MADATADGVLRVGVFRGETPETIARAVERARLDLIQLHRPLTKADLDRAPVPVIAVAPASPGGDGPEEPAVALVSRCHAVLLDSSEGTGRPFDASGAARARARWPVPVFVAGGLDADTVGAVIRSLRPAAVDVASGAESAPGIKDRARLERLFDAVREADREA